MDYRKAAKRLLEDALRAEAAEGAAGHRHEAEGMAETEVAYLGRKRQAREARECYRRFVRDSVPGSLREGRR
jgi:hypothetical protein